MDWNDYAATWDEKEGVREYSQAAFDSLLSRCQELSFALEGSRALDFGCGTGLLSTAIATQCREVVALDSSKQMIGALEAKAIDRVQALAGTLSDDLVATNEHFREPFDLVVCSSVCAFVDDYPGTVALLARQLRPGGLFVQWDWELEPNADEPFGFTRDQIRSALAAAGLEVLSVDTGFRVPVGDQTMTPLMGVGRVPVDES